MAPAPTQSMNPPYSVGGGGNVYETSAYGSGGPQQHAAAGNIFGGQELGKSDWNAWAPPQVG